MNDAALRKLEQTLAAEMPICTPMGIRPVAWDGCRLAMEMPLAPNRNHQYSAFAGSLNALCTIVGWGKVFLMLHHAGLSGNIVIRRSQIRYLRPVRSEAIVAHNLPIEREAETFFFELLRSHGASKIDVSTEIVDGDGSLVSFHGSYVVQD
ncbi:MAG TPA: YiiD C-terminal domain-containing protein [Lacipirellula sp.]